MHLHPGRKYPRRRHRDCAEAQAQKRLLITATSGDQAGSEAAVPVGTRFRFRPGDVDREKRGLPVCTRTFPGEHQNAAIRRPGRPFV